MRRVVSTDERRRSEGEIVNEEGAAGVAAVTGGVDLTPPAGGKGKKRGKRSRQGHKAERSEVGSLALMCLRPLTPA